jgi:hypothetical protein
MRLGSIGVAALWLALAASLVLESGALAAQAKDQDLEIGYFGTNRLQFAVVGNAPVDATGKGIIDYRGGDEPSSSWRASFRFSGLDAGATYTVVVRGRFGEAGSDEATAFTPLCSFTTNDNGRGSCFWYFRGLARLNVVQLRAGDENGARVMQASRSDSGAGSITTEANRYSPGGEVATRAATGKGKVAK